jgi:hypothetical protein
VSLVQGFDDQAGVMYNLKAGKEMSRKRLAADIFLRVPGGANALACQFQLTHVIEADA